MKTCKIYRVPGDDPDMSCFAQGAFTNGYLIEMQSPTEFTPESVDELPNLVAVAGGLNRYRCKNRDIVNYHVFHGVPSIICEFGRLVPKTQMLMVNTKPWLPSRDMPADRVEKLGLVPSFRHRGENILVCGQRPDLDCQLEDAVKELKLATGRRVVYRPHPNMWRLIDEHGRRPTYTFPHADVVSNRCDGISQQTERDLELDLDEAWCVVTHSSIIAVTAALRGIPTIATPDCVAHKICFPLNVEPDEIFVNSGENLQRFLNALSYTIWTEKEIRLGRALKALKEFF